MMRIHPPDLDFQDLHHAIAAFVVEGPGGVALVETGPYSTDTHTSNEPSPNTAGRP